MIRVYEMRHSYWVAGLLMCLGLLMGGCKAPGMTRQQVHMRHVDAIEQNWLQMQDDIDAVFLIDRPSRMSRMMVR